MGVSFQRSRVTLYTVGQLAHSPATFIHTAVLIVLPGHGCVNNGGTAVWTMGHGCVQVPGCVEGHPWKYGWLKHFQNVPQNIIIFCEILGNSQGN